MKFFGGVVPRSAFLVAGLIVSAMVVSGCSQGSPVASNTPQPSQTSSQSPSATLPASMTPAEAKAAYKLIAKASCNKAQAEGVVETGATFKAVMTNKDQGYQDFTAAYFEEPDTYSIIWELDGFNACADWFTFSMADEAGQEAAIDVTFDPTDSSFIATQDLGDLGVSSRRFSVENGMIATATNLAPNGAGVVNLKYGNLSNDDLGILKTAVDRYVATIN